MIFFIKLSGATMDDYKKINDEIGRHGQIETSFVVSSFINDPSITISKI